MADFLKRNRAEVVKMCLYEYDEEKTMRMFRKETLEDGIHAVIKTCRKFNIPSDDIIQSLIANFQISENEAKEYLDKYTTQSS